MGYDRGLAQIVREFLEHEPGYDEKEMFGGIGFLLYGNMACGILNNDLIVRVGPENYEETLDLPHTRKFDITGRPMKGWVMVSFDGLESEEVVQQWIKKGATFSLSLPPK